MFRGCLIQGPLLLVLLCSSSTKGKEIDRIFHCNAMRTSIKCSADPLCIGFVMRMDTARNCQTLHRASTETQLVMPDTQNIVFKRDCSVLWCGPPDWPAGDQPALYRSFDVIGSSFQFNNGPQLTSGRIGKAGTTDRNQRQWIEVNGAAAACLSKVETCGPEGTTLAFWIKMDQCGTAAGGIISSQVKSPLSTGLHLFCRNSLISWRLALLDKLFIIDNPAQLSQWVHYALVLNDGVTIYENGNLATTRSSEIAFAYQPGPGRILIGRSYVDEDEDYASIVVDELLMWNRKLTQPEIQKIFDLN